MNEEKCKERIDEAFAKDVPLWKLLQDVFEEGKREGREQAVEEWSAIDHINSLEEAFRQGRKALVEEAEKKRKMVNCENTLQMMVKVSDLKEIAEDGETY